MKTRIVFGVAGLVVSGVVAPAARATNTVLNAFAARYPNSTLLARMQSSTGDRCLLCHETASRATAGNCYKQALAARMRAGRSEAQAIVDVENVDSDGDGTPNGVEIAMARTDLPGQVGYNPGLIGAAGSDPCATNTSRAVTSQRETPPPPPAPRTSTTAAGSDTPMAPSPSMTCSISWARTRTGAPPRTSTMAAETGRTTAR